MVRISFAHALVSVCLNVAFFYVLPNAMRAHWSDIRAWFGTEYHLFVVGELVAHEVAFVGATLTFEVLYAARWAWIEQYKIQQQCAWPWLDARPAERERWRALRVKTIAMMAFNRVFLTAPLTFLFYESAVRDGMSAAVETFPSWWALILQIGAFMIIQDVMFYFSHRALHHRSIYPYVHKLHHEYRTSVGLTSEYAHPIEFLFG
jgi:sterol desaturase/sphingolipid hydroxylase (fatty acid hydroxylase superfamily)